ncbi:MAG TPA: hypothetical protein VIH99_00705 [Bdellovibrionota bacterium]|jgi:hypothetical protein
MKSILIAILTLTAGAPFAQASECKYQNGMRFTHLFVYPDDSGLGTVKCKYVKATSDDDRWNYKCNDGSTAYMNPKSSDDLHHSGLGLCKQLRGPYPW